MGDVVGLDDALRKIRRVIPIVEREAATEVRGAATRTRGTARRYAPVRTGRLRDAIEVNEDGPLQQSVAVTGEPAIYAPAVEYGTARMSAQPFMRPALDENTQPYIDRMTRTGRTLEQELSR